MGYIPPEKILEAKEIDLLTYLKNYVPEELVHICGNAYTIKNHDSLKISNGKWNWFSRGIGGKTALDYLIKVEGLSFIEAVERILGQAEYKPPVFYSKEKAKEKPKTILLPKQYINNDKVINYLKRRGIDNGIIDYCISTNRVYESNRYHSAVFIGLDKDAKPRYATIRGIDNDFIGEANGSDKRYSFNIPSKSDTLCLFESAIDLLSFSTLLNLYNKLWNENHLVSLAGVYRPKEDYREDITPLALKRYLSEYPNIKIVQLCLDNDIGGRITAEALKEILPKKYGITVTERFPPKGKDYNDYLCDILGLPRTQLRRKEYIK